MIEIKKIMWLEESPEAEKSEERVLQEQCAQRWKMLKGGRLPCSTQTLVYFLCERTRLEYGTSSSGTR